MTVDNTEGDYVAERIRTSELAVGGSSPVEALLANSLREGKPLTDDGSLYDTVQGAENAASSFVFVPPGSFNESVTVDTPGMTLLGSGRASLIDGGTIGDAITVTASNVTIEALSVKTPQGNGANHLGIFGQASNMAVRNVHSPECDSVPFVSENAPDSKFINCTAKNTDNYAVQCSLRTTVIGCVFESVDNGITDTDDDCIVAHNIINGTTSGDGVGFGNNDHIIIGNRIHNASGNGIQATGNDIIIANNRVSDSGGQDIDDSGTGTVLDANLTGSAN